MTALEYIESKGFEFKIQSGQIVFNCPFCQDTKNHFYMDQAEGVFFCHKCQERGNLKTLQKHLGDYEPSRQRSGNMKTTSQNTIKQAFPEESKTKVTLKPERALEAHERLLNDPDALSYVTVTRGISLEAVKHFQLGLEIQDSVKWLTIPHYFKGKLVNIKFRSIPPAEKNFKRVTGCPSVLFNGDILKEKPDTVYICEGEIDSISLWCQGIKNVIGTTTGAGSFDPEWLDQLQDVKKIILCYDNDIEAGGKNPGQTGAREVARRLGYERVFNIILPGVNI